jgi:membrane protein
MLTLYSDVGGSVLAGGIAYAGLFSLFAGLTITFTVFARVLGANRSLAEQVDQQISSWLPGVLDTGHGGLVSPEALVRSGALSVTSVIAGVVLVWSALSVMTAVRTALRSVFGLGAVKGSLWKSRLTALAGFAVLGAGLLVSAIIGLAAAWGEGWVRQALGSPGVAHLLGWAAYGVSWLVDALILAGAIRFVAGARPRLKDLAEGCLAGAAAMGVLKRLGAGVVASASSNPLLASAAGVVTLLVWVNLLARVLLYAAAWVATPGSGLAGAGAGGAAPGVLTADADADAGAGDAAGGAGAGGAGDAAGGAGAGSAGAGG